MPPVDPRGGQPLPIEPPPTMPLNIKFDALSGNGQRQLKYLMSRTYLESPLEVGDEELGNADLNGYSRRRVETDTYYEAFVDGGYTLERFLARFPELRDDILNILYSDENCYRQRLAYHAVKMAPKISAELNRVGDPGTIVHCIVLASRYDDDFVTDMVSATNKRMYIPIVERSCKFRRCEFLNRFGSSKPVKVDIPALQNKRPDAVKKLLKDAIETGNIPFLVVYTDYMKKLSEKDDGKFGDGLNLRWIMKRLERSFLQNGDGKAKVYVLVEKKGDALPKWLDPESYKQQNNEALGNGEQPNNQARVNAPTIIGYLSDPVEA